MVIFPRYKVVREVIILARSDNKKMEMLNSKIYSEVSITENNFVRIHLN